MIFRLLRSLSLMLSITLLIFYPKVWADGSFDHSQSKAYLQQYLRQLGEKYPFAEWEKELVKSRRDFDLVRNKINTSNGNFDLSQYNLVNGIKNEMANCLKHRSEANNLMRELYAPALISHIDGLYIQTGNTWNREAKGDFQKSLRELEPGSLKPKSLFLSNIAALDRDYRGLQNVILFAFAQDYLGHRVEDHLRNLNFAKNEALYDDYVLQLDFWTKQMNDNASQSLDQLKQLSKKYEENKNSLRQNLEKLLEVLNTDMLYSDLLEYANQQKVEFSLEVEEKIETSLKEKNSGNLAPIQERIILWKTFATNLRDKIDLSQKMAKKQKPSAMASLLAKNSESGKNSEQGKNSESHTNLGRSNLGSNGNRDGSNNQESGDDLGFMDNHSATNPGDQDKLEFLHADQRKLEDAQKNKFKQTITALRTFSFKSETSVELDDDSKKALATKAGFLKTSYVRSGSNKLKVDKDHFSDTLAIVEKFKVEDKQVDFSKMSLGERSNQSAYTYASPEGRTNQGDLANFVAEVALGSFSSFYSFLSYSMPSHWSPGRSIGWVANRADQKVTTDREFSYVDLVVDAHRKRGTTAVREESSANLPANLIVILDPHGSIVRYQSFSDIGQVAIKASDLVGGKLYYKFLNYTTDRQHIYLNGIDEEMKIASP